MKFNKPNKRKKQHRIDFKIRIAWSYNSTVNLLLDLKQIATKGFLTVSYTEKCAL